MATLQVTNLQNTAATVTNVSLLADGTTTLVLNATGTNRTGGLRYNAGTLEVYTSGGVWASAGGGGGTVTGVTASAPLSSSGGTAPVISLTGSVPVANGGTGATTQAAALTNLLPAQGPNAGKFLTTDGSSVSWGTPGGGGTVTSVTGTLPITVATGTTTPLIAINAATTAATGSVQLATQAEAITGTDAVKASTPATAVAKTTADQTGFIVTPSSAAAPATTGYLHYNTTSNHIEYFAAAAAKTVVEREGDNMTGKLSVTPSAIAAGVGGWLLTTSNYWTVGALAFPLPTGLSAGQGGLIQMTAAPTSWPAAGGILKYTGGTAPAPTAFPAILPYYSNGTNVYLGTATENIS